MHSQSDIGCGREGEREEKRERGGGIACVSHIRWNARRTLRCKDGIVNKWRRGKKSAHFSISVLIFTCPLAITTSMKFKEVKNSIHHPVKNFYKEEEQRKYENFLSFNISLLQILSLFP